MTPPGDAGSVSSIADEPEPNRPGTTKERSVFHLPFQKFYDIKSLVVIFFILGIVGECGAQSLETTLGVVRSIATPGAFSHLKMVPDSGRTVEGFLLWNERSKEVCYLQFDSTFEHSTATKHFLPLFFDDVMLVDVNEDSKPEIVFLSKVERTISVVLDLSADTLRIAQSIRLPLAPTGWSVGDVNHDGKTDILIFDRNNPGIVPLFGKGGGVFSVGRIIAPDLAFGCIAVTHLNNDNLLDIVAYDWVKSELHLLYGVGRGRFLDQSTFRILGDVTSIIPIRPDPSNNLDLFLIEDHPSEVQDWQGNAVGDFRLTKKARLQDGVVSCALGDLNADQWIDVGYITKSSSLQILLNTGDDWSQDRIPFWVGEDPVSLVFRDCNGDGKADAIVLDRNGEQIRFYFNGAQDYILTDSLEFATAPSPAGIVIHKFGGGMRRDLAIAGLQSRTLSLLTHTDSSDLRGETSVSLSINPQYLSFHSLTDSSVRFVVTSAAGDSLSLVSLNYRDSSSSYAVIPSEGSVQVVQTGINDLGHVEFFTFNTFAGDQKPDIHYYERLDPGTFIEQSFHLGEPDELLGATAAFLNADQYPDLVYIYHNADSGNVDLTVSYGDSLLSYSQRHSTLELTGMRAAPSFIWANPLRHPDTIDLLIYFGAPANTLDIAWGKGNGQFELPVVVQNDLRLANRAMLQIIDADNDGHADIVLNNATSGMLGWLRGTSDGIYEPWQPLVSVDSAEFFAVGDLNEDGIADIALSRTAQGTVKIYNGTLMFRKRIDAEVH